MCHHNCHHVSTCVIIVHGVFMFAHDEKLKLKVCLKVYIDYIKNNQTLSWRISKIIICSTLAFFVKTLLVLEYH